MNRQCIRAIAERRGQALMRAERAGRANPQPEQKPTALPTRLSGRNVKAEIRIS